ncbi:MAG: hypothetical protein WDO19_21535 [Bacteroidota bacterium]
MNYQLFQKCRIELKNVEVCDARDDDSSNEAGQIEFPSLIQSSSNRVTMPAFTISTGLSR